MNTSEKLEKYTELQAQSDVIRMKKEELRNSVLTPEIKQALQDIDDEFRGPEAALEEQITTIKNEIINEVKNLGKSVKGGAFQAVYSGGHTSWNTKALEAYLNDTEKKAFRTTGEPSVSIRKAG